MTDKETRLNDALTNAAPDMLLALKVIRLALKTLREWVPDHSGGPDCLSITDMVATAHAAIAKAEDV